jgi:DNA-binding beta-propeller fold protein YncE
VGGLHWPHAVALDATEANLYIADPANHRIRKVELATRMITTVAGTGEGGFAGDGGPAVAAQLDDPKGVVVGPAGDLYIADSANDRIRRVDPSGTIITIAGTGETGFSGDGGPAVAARLNGPRSLALDGAGNLYVADDNNDRIRRVDPSGMIITIAGTGVTGFSGDGGPAVAAQLARPRGVAVDAAGNVYVADCMNHRIRMVDVTGTIRTVAGSGRRGYSGDGGPAAEARLFLPRGVAVDPGGNLYIADTYNQRVRVVKAVG